MNGENKDKPTLLIVLVLVSVLLVSGCISDYDRCQEVDLGNSTCEEITEAFKCCYDNSPSAIQGNVCANTYSPIIAEVCYE